MSLYVFDVTHGCEHTETVRVVLDGYCDEQGLITRQVMLDIKDGAWRHQCRGCRRVQPKTQ